MQWKIEIRVMHGFLLKSRHQFGRFIGNNEKGLLNP